LGRAIKLGTKSRRESGVCTNSFIDLRGESAYLKRGVLIIFEDENTGRKRRWIRKEKGGLHDV